MTNSKRLPSLITNSLNRLDLSRTNKKGALLPSLHHFCEVTGSTRQRRADRRANIFNVLSVVLPQIDLDTFTWGQWFTRHDGKTDFYTRGIDYISKESGMNERTICRALSDLEKSGYIKVKRTEGMGKSGKEIRHYSLRTFTNKFFKELGFKNKTIEETRAWKRKRNEKQYYNKKATTKCTQGVAKINSMFKKFGLKKNKTYKTMHPVKQNISVSDTQNLLHKASELAELSGRSPMDIYAELIAKGH